MRWRGSIKGKSQTHDDFVITGEDSEEACSRGSGPNPSPSRLVPSLSVAGISGISFGGTGGTSGTGGVRLADSFLFIITTDIAADRSENDG